ncbi:PEP/pyruvate-binding domain-containing protein [Pseudonocardia alaniniphila]|uniref:PEP-utilizing enzyme n=1 Tax=Pseudonocardia alaniniphila TaxID=75291 RepID=A0ABS9TL46_9PSEU|nr:PEP/pyruvate-binding domain-containing protein [Pseudonocardia alaniniphila]MCH6169245.1 PEP-utilizing enzyme [Pseudonocardia alaniniphila]
MAVNELVVDLHHLGSRELSRAGGKGANLGELIGTGFPVPPGFVVTTEAYSQVAAAAGLQSELDGDARLGERARTALLATPVPARVADAVCRSYLALGEKVPVAVRSSATAEDLPSASFAGQQDTFLNVVGIDAVLDAVHRCWASLWTDRAVSYRADAGIDHHVVRLAVVVQRMVDAQVAGVLFTADPVTGTRTRTVIDASPGLGEAVVSGAVNPDHIVVEGEGRIVEHRLGDKAVEVRPVAGGGTEQVIRSGGAARSSLTDAQITSLVTLGRRVEAYYRAPQDIEWAIDGDGALWLTQSRPITTLHPLPQPTGHGLRVYLCASLAQGLTRPITPMGLSAFRVITSVPAAAFGVPIADPVAGPPAFVTAGGRAFADITPGVRSAVGRAILPRMLDIMEARSAVVLRALFDEPALAVQTTSRWPFVRRVAKVLVHHRVPALLALSLLRPAAARQRVDRIGHRLRTLSALPADAAPEQRLDHVQRVLTQLFPIMPRVAPVFVSGLAMLAVARKLAGDDLDGAASHEVLRSLPHNTTTEMDLELWALATRLRGDAGAAEALRGTPAAELACCYRDGALPPVLQQGLRAFLARHWHRAVAEIDLGMPRWSDDPSHVLGVLANYLRLDDPELAPDAVFARGALAADAAVAAAVERVRRRSRVRAFAVRLALRRVRQLVGMRETHKDFVIRLLAYARAEFQVVGELLAARGLLSDPADVYFLDLAEARSALAGADHRATVAERRETYDRELRRRHVPRMLLSDGTEPETLSRPVDAEGALTGTPASAGTVTAPARVVLDPIGAHLEPGEILVVPSTDPGWTPLFLTAGGLVMEMGGPNSHGAVVAREYGIPAVVGVADATTRIRTGQQVTVDGAAGLVRLPS